MPLLMEIPEKLVPVIAERARYKVLRGGRGSAKSWTVARHFIAEAACNKFRYLCTREVQNSIKDSVHKLLCDQIHELGLGSAFTIQKDVIYSKCGSEFIFKGLKHDAHAVKSMEGIDRCWVEEAEKISKISWELLIPTIRKEGSEIYVVFNPEEEGSETSQRFIKNPPPNTISIEINFCDNPWFPDVLRQEMEYDKKTDFEKYEHVWLGKYKRYAEDLIFKGKFVVEEFEPPAENTRLYFGSDFGFSVDPSVLGGMFIKNRCLYIDREAYGVGVELDELHRFFHSVPDAGKWPITADSQRPDTISFLRRPYTHKDGTVYPGFNIAGAEKGKGSVEDGLTFLRGFEKIFIHPRCRGAKDNFENYRWKRDRVTMEILPIPLDANNHWPDAARYALEKLIKSKLSIYDVMRRAS